MNDKPPPKKRRGVKEAFTKPGNKLKALYKQGNPAAILIPGGEIQIRDTAQAIAHQFGKGTPIIYSRGGALCEVVGGKIEDVEVHGSKTRFETRCEFVKFVKVKDKPALVSARLSSDDARAVLRSRELHDGLPPISLVAQSPVITETAKGDLRILSRRYNKECGGVLVKKPIKIDETIDGDRAVAEILRILTDFDFMSPGDKARAFMGFITPALRFGGLIHGPVAVDIAEADQSQSGKTFRQRLVRIVYGEKASLRSLHDKGVGGVNESIQAALFSGQPFIVMDNVRGKIEAQTFEMAITAEAGEAVEVRLPYRGYSSVDPTRMVFQISSNAAEMTVDLANRCSISRIRKRPPGYRFQKFDGKPVDRFLAANRPYFLSCIFALIREWHAAGKPQTIAPFHHDFGEWHGVAEWFCQRAGLGSVMDGHGEAKARVASTAQSWLRQVVLAAAESKKIGEPLQAHDLIEISDEHDIDIPRVRDGADDKTRSMVVGRLLKSAFGKAKSETMEVDGFTIHRSMEERYVEDRQGYLDVKIYTIHPPKK